MHKSSKMRLYNSLVGKGWEKIKEDHPEGEVLRFNNVEVLFLSDAFEVYYYVRGELTFGIWYPYGRRQSQQLQREVERYSKWRGEDEVSIPVRRR